MSNQRFSFGRNSGRALLFLGSMLVWSALSPAQPTSHLSAQAPASTAAPAHTRRSLIGTGAGVQAGTGIGAASEASSPADTTLSRDGAITVHPGGRDPFKLPPPPPPPSKGKGGASPPANLPPGPRGLIISGLKLEGVVSENSGREMIAVVTNDTDRAYFLRTNEQLYDGAVTRITPQGIFFTEHIRDHHGRESVQVVVKRLNPKPGDGQ
ncbi:MAG: hypothetical protein ACRD18_14615 [Terriglobia bacterium]